MPTIDDIRSAARRLKGIANTTPVMRSRTLDAMLGCETLFKCENFQRSGSFKFRGAYNAVSNLSAEERKKGVTAHSSGNHAQALALAARLLGISCTVVMPENSVRCKVEAVRGYGAHVVFCGTMPEDREKTVCDVMKRTGMTLIHPYDNENVIAGAGTAAYELCMQTREQPRETVCKIKKSYRNRIDIIFCPVGGGGLISGTSIAVKSLAPGSKVIGVEPEKADDAARSFRLGRIVRNKKADTIADGLRTNLCERTFDIIRKNVDDIITVKESEIKNAAAFHWNRMKIVVEPSGAVALAGLIRVAKDASYDIHGKRIGLIVSGGNMEIGAKSICGVRSRIL